MRKLLFLLLLALALATPAIASDGVLEINQTCAVQTGCFSGDTAGYPITLDGSAGRSYRLTSDLIVPDENTDGIRVVSSDQSIDLNGFEIVRSGCEGATVNCSLIGTGSGIDKPDGVIVRGISVKNGTITGMGEWGVRLNTQSQVSGMRLRWIGFSGVVVGVASIVSGNTVLDSGSGGIEAGSGSIVSGNVVFSNLNGIDAGPNAAVSGNVVVGNSFNGIEADANATVSGNIVTNGTRGLVLDATSVYRDNTVAGNSTTTVIGGINAGGNLCNGSLTCP